MVGRKKISLMICNSCKILYKHPLTTMTLKLNCKFLVFTTRELISLNIFEHNNIYKQSSQKIAKEKKIYSPVFKNTKHIIIIVVGHNSKKDPRHHPKSCCFPHKPQHNFKHIEVETNVIKIHSPSSIHKIVFLILRLDKLYGKT